MSDAIVNTSELFGAWFWVSIVGILVLLIFSGFFSGSETALTAASKARMMQLEKSGDKRANLVNQLIASRERLIGSLLLGNNFVNILASALATSILVAIFREAGVIYTTIIMTLLVLIFAEILPKMWAISTPERFALAVAPIVKVIVAIFGWPINAIELFIRFLLKLFGINIDKDQAILSAQDEVRSTVDLQHMEGGLVKDQKDRIGGVLDLIELEVSDVMVHRTDMESIDLKESPHNIVDQVLKSSHTRLPVWRDKADNIVGILHAKDLLRELHKADGKIDQLNILKIAQTPWFVPNTTNLQSQLNEFLRRKSHFALVVDEYGEMMGHVTLEDILEEIVGEISDEHDVELEGVLPQPDRSVIVNGSVPVRDLNRAMDWDLPDEEATTIAGLVIHDAQMIPEERQIFTFHGFRFIVLKKEKNKILSLRMIPVNSKPKAEKPALEQD